MTIFSEAQAELRAKELETKAGNDHFDTKVIEGEIFDRSKDMLSLYGSLYASLSQAGVNYTEARNRILEELEGRIEGLLKSIPPGQV